MSQIDIVNRLRFSYEKRELPTWGEIGEAADEIERLRTVITSQEIKMQTIQHAFDLGFKAAGGAIYPIESTMEHIARDIRDGIFPKRS